MPKVSVIVPVYNVEKHLSSCIDSILCQSFKDFELILVDDGSPDNCPKICDEYAQKDSRIKVIHKENGGVSSARNRGIDASTGEYICFVDSDDTVTDEYINCLLSDCLENSSGLSVGDINCIGNSFNDSSLESSVMDFNNVDEHSLRKFYKNLSYLTGPCGKLYISEIIKENNIHFLEDVHFAEDTIFVFSYLLYCQKISFISKKIYNYHLENSVATKKHWPDMPIYIEKRFVYIKRFFDNVQTSDELKKEIFADLAIEAFRITVYRQIFKTKFLRFVKEYNYYYKLYSPYFAKSSFVSDNGALKEMKFFEKKQKNRYFLFIHKKVLKDFLKNQYSKRKR